MTRKDILADLRIELARAERRTTLSDPLQRAQALGEAGAYREAIRIITGERRRQRNADAHRAAVEEGMYQE